MHKKSPSMMLALFGSLVMMMTVSMVCYVPQDGTKKGIVSSILAMNIQPRNTEAGGRTPLSDTRQSPENIFGK